MAEKSRAQRVLDEIRQRLESARSVKVGFLAGATYPNGTSVAMVAAIQEFGAPRAGIPPRPFMRPTAQARAGDWGREMVAALAASNGDATRALSMVGESAAGDIRMAIAALYSPGLSPVTLMLRKMKAETPGLKVTRTVVEQARQRVLDGESTSGVSTKPLVETGLLINAVEYEVE